MFLVSRFADVVTANAFSECERDGKGLSVFLAQRKKAYSHATGLVQTNVRHSIASLSSHSLSSNTELA